MRIPRAFYRGAPRSVQTRTSAWPNTPPRPIRGHHEKPTVRNGCDPHETSLPLYGLGMVSRLCHVYPLALLSAAILKSEFRFCCCRADSWQSHSGRSSRGIIELVWPDFILHVFAEPTIPRTFKNCKKGCCMSNTLPAFVTKHPPFVGEHFVHVLWGENASSFSNGKDEATLVLPSTHSTSTCEVPPCAQAAGDTRTWDEQ